MARPLLITDQLLVEIAEAVRKARANPIPWEVLAPGAVDDPGPDFPLKDRKPGFERPPSIFVEIPVGYRAAISFEMQPLAGLCRHLSVSVSASAEGKVPSIEAVEMIAAAFGFDKKKPSRAWLEEFAPGERAVNIVQPEKA